MKVIRECEECGKEFEPSPSSLKNGGGKFCSFPCVGRFSNRSRKKEPNCECAYCGEPIYRKESKIRKSKTGLFFCCREHKDISSRVETPISLSPAHYGTSKQYRVMALRNLPNVCNRCGYNKHPEILEVHHIDRDRDNNVIDNLEIVCPTCHQEDHFLNGDGKWSS